MKKVSLFAIMGALAITGARAEFVETVTTTGPGGFVDANQIIVTTDQVKEMRDDVPVIVQGYIIKNLGDENYLFKDDAGSIIVEIDDENWAGLTITPNDLVKLYGDVDAGLFTTEIEVDRIEK